MIHITEEFNKFVSQLQQDFPEESKTITFVDLSDDDAERQLEHWLVKSSRECRQGVDYRTMTLALLEHNSSSALYDPINHTSLLIVGKDNGLGSDFTILNDGEKFKAFCIAHEFAHLVMKNGISDFIKKMEPSAMQFRKDKERNMAEIAADSFALFYLLQKGMVDVHDIYDLGLFRIQEAVNLNSIGHLTTLAVDNILLKLEDTDFVSLSPAEIKAVAEEHATETLRSAHMLEEAIKKIGQEPGIDYEDDGRTRTRATSVVFRHLMCAPEPFKGAEAKWVELLGANCLAAPEGSIEFHFAARMLLDVFKTNEIRYFNTIKVDTTGPEWDGLKAAINDRVAKDPLTRKISDTLDASQSKLKVPKL